MGGKKPHDPLGAGLALEWLQHAAIWACVCDRHGNLLWVNRAMQAELGLTEASQDHPNIQQIMPWHNAARLASTVTEVMASGEERQFDDVWILGSETRWRRTRCFRLGADASSDQVAVQSEDITREHTLREQAALSEAIFANALEAIAVLDEEGRLVRVNPAWTRLTGFSDLNAIDRTLATVFDAQTYPGMTTFASFWRAITSRTHWTGELRLRRSDGISRLTWASLNALDAGCGQSGGYLAVFTDMSELERSRASLVAHRNRLEEQVQYRTQELDAARREAESASLAKSDFMGAISHELRTPLNAILGMSHLMLQTPLETIQREYAQHISQAGRQLLGLVDDVLDYVRQDARTEGPELTYFELAPLLEHWAHPWQQLAAAKGLGWAVSLKTGTPAQWKGPARELLRILDKLADNAVKFCDRGAIELVVYADPVQVDGRTPLHLQIHDTGRGMGLAERQALFSLFRQGDASPRRRHGGTGLGLALAARVATRIGAELDCLESHRGRGSVFELRALLETVAEPLGATPAPATDQPPPANAAAATVKRPPGAHPQAEWESVRGALIRLLDRWDAEALGIARQHADLIREMLGERYAFFDHALARFDFDKAAGCLQNQLSHHDP